LSIRDRQKTTFIVSQEEKSFISRRFFLAEGDKTICCGKIVKQQVDLLDFYRLFFWLTLKEHNMFKRILIAFITVCSFAMADPIDNLDEYRIYVKAVDEDFHVVALSNGLICQVIPQDFWLEKNLEVGDEVELGTNVAFVEQLKERGELMLLLRKDNILRKIAVWVTEESKKNGLIYVSDTTRTLQPVGLFSQAVKETIIELSNGSKWVSDGLTLPKEDHVVLTYNTVSHQWFLISLDKPEIMKADQVGPFNSSGNSVTYFNPSVKDLVAIRKAIVVTPFKEDGSAP
jgi:hypothetical protein